ncbi:MAG: hypothetical protein M3377_05575, partial [Actinomycetota bacterium]|nr:hypothetical protein [Actinomycetota bacterium]
TQACPLDHERLLDCNHDDYFHTSPSLDSYLATHWNTASSSFLTNAGADSTGPDVTAPDVTAPILRFTGTTGKTLVPVTVSWSAKHDTNGIVSTELAQSVDGGEYTNLTLSEATSTRVRRWLSPGHSYGYRAAATDGVGNTASAEAVGLVPSVRQESARTIGYSGTWTRVAAPYVMGGYTRYAKVRRASASTSFSGRGVAWVSRRGPGSGKAYVYVDGQYAATVNLYSSVGRARRIVFARSWPTPGAHRLFVSVAGTSGHPRVDLDAFLFIR